MFRHQLFLVARQTFKTRTKTFGYWALVLSPIIIAVFALGIGLAFSATSDKSTPVMGVNASSELVTYLKKDQSLKVKVKKITSDKKALQQLKNDQIDSYLTTDSKGFIVQNASKGNPVDSASLQSALTKYSMLVRAVEMNLTPEQLTHLITPPTITTTVISDKGVSQGGEAAQTAKYILSTALGIFIFIFLTAYIGMIANEISNEKSSRIMEILLAATSPAVQFFGKIIGIGALAIMHIFIYGIVGAVIYLIVPDNKFIKMGKAIFHGVDLSFAVLTIIMVLLGITMFIILTAIIAALVNDQSQVQQAVMPVTYLAMLGYILTLASEASSTLLIKIFSFVPFTSQTLMPARLGLQLARPYEVVIAIALQIITVWFLAQFGLRVYKKNVLQYNDGNLAKAGILSLKGLFTKDKKI
ncbi:MAG: ABC transporter permease [Lactobacillaceae bacterium]|jgi:ABC-2 type transport system permease protein|nr:ABC transporter permease [Lactobacillaceae bacterium]